MSAILPPIAPYLSHDPDRVGELIALLGAAQFDDLLEQLHHDWQSVTNHVAASGDAARIAAMLHRLQGSASALGMVAASEGVARAASDYAADRQGFALDQCLTRLKQALLPPGIARQHVENARRRDHAARGSKQ